MSEAANNPKIVVDAILAESTDAKVSIYPVTLRRYALLERLGSPFIDPAVEFTVDSIVPSVFIMSRTVAELKQYCNADKAAIKDAAFDWSESLSIDDLPKMVEAVTDQFFAIQKAAPDAGAAKPQDAKKNQADM